MDSLFSVLTVPKKKKSLSCDNISDISTSTDCRTFVPKRKNSAGTSSSHTIASHTLPRLRFRPKSPLIRSMDRAKSFGSGDIVSDVDDRLVQIKKQLAEFRKQNVRLRERMGSLSSSIDDIASSSAASEVSAASDLVIPSNDIDTNEELDYKDDHQSFLNDIRSVSMSFSCEVLNRIPSIAVECYKTRQASDPELHETIK